MAVYILAPVIFKQNNTRHARRAVWRQPALAYALIAVLLQNRAYVMRLVELADNIIVFGARFALRQLRRRGLRVGSCHDALRSRPVAPQHRQAFRQLGQGTPVALPAIFLASVGVNAWGENVLDRTRAQLENAAHGGPL